LERHGKGKKKDGRNGAPSRNQEKEEKPHLCGRVLKEERGKKGFTPEDGRFCLIVRSDRVVKGRKEKAPGALTSCGGIKKAAARLWLIL